MRTAIEVIFVLAAGVVVYSMILFAQDQADTIKDYAREYDELAVMYKAIPDWKKKLEVTCHTEGMSSYPMYVPGECRLIIAADEAPIGAEITFKCNAERCKGDEEEALYQKRLLKEENGCIWVEGENKRMSFDSRHYGWLCNDEYEMRHRVIGEVDPGSKDIVRPPEKVDNQAENQ